MDKEIKTEIEIATMINEEIRKHDVCKDVRVFVSRIPDDGVTNWEVSWVRGSGTSVLPDCKRAVIAIVQQLQRRYELSTDA